MQAVHKAWDSQFFGKEIYELVLDDADTKNPAEILQAYPTVFWQSQTNIGDFKHINLLLQSGFTWASNSVKFAKTSLNALPKQNVLTKARMEDLEQIRLYLPGLYTDSRYRIRGFFTEADADRFYDIWLQKAYSGDFDDEILVLLMGDVAAGFVTLKYLNQHAKIGLIGVNPAFTAKGIGTSILSSLEAHCQTMEISTISVQTQLANLPAIKLYAKMGYNITEITSWFYKAEKMI
ncbi:MAG: GNAT family N-acetyltransferase [Candidatus Cloacimonetes bacterium]|nr:GNAT family N-acetyltransferase [Candidatus Cloacimonadota bacterium]